ncbi:MAG TPA: AAA family ATPase, partial [Ilumatobacteraceae bacterium]|nr:AAA family ATPase [Ilumatobacteraceae bacterium]
MTDTSTTLLFPVLDLPAVVLPGAVLTMALESDQAQAAARAAQQSGNQLVLRMSGPDGTPSEIGVLAKLPNVGNLPGGAPAAIVQAERRVRLVAVHASERGATYVEIESITDPPTWPRLDATLRELRIVLEEIARLRGSRRLPEILRSVFDPGALADAVITWGEAGLAVRFDVLNAVEVAARVDIVLAWAKDHLAELQVSAQIRADVTEGVDKQQREYLLRQQLAAIRNELGEGDDDVIAEYRTKLAAAALPAAAHNQVSKEIDRLERLGQQSPEHSWVRTWLDRIFDLPWSTRTDEHLDLAAARLILDRDHYGLDDVKDRIVEQLAVRKLIRDRALKHTDRATTDGDESADANHDRSAADERHANGAIMLLVGPPGVGKTSLGESVARAMGRNFVRVSLGGVRDEAEIRGHRRTYVGSQPGRIVRAITEAGSMNPVILLDEIDKLSAGGWSGDPTAALLEVLDPAQNHTFRDHYLELDLDLSDVVFIATANVADTIPGPLLDRMEFVRLDGYTEDEKVFIAQRYLVPRQLRRAGLDADEVSVSDGALRAVISG